MNIYIVFFLSKNMNILKKIKRLVIPSSKIIDEWFSINGDATLREEYDLNKSSIIFDLGGYKGQWTSDMFSRYACKIYTFEPVKRFFLDIEKRFYRNDKIDCFNFGLSNVSEKKSIFLSGDASSLYGKGKKEIIKLQKFSEFIEDQKIKKIDLIKINIEGGEYELLDHIFQKNLQDKINNFQIQFHRNVKNFKEKREKIQKELIKTHKLTYNFPYVWENWERKTV
jgi:FkbM family methyltransferase